MTRTAIEDAVRAWLVAAGVAGGVPDADRAVIVADQDGPRPQPPYVVVRVLLYDLPVHQDERLVDDADPPRWRARGNRTGTVSVNAFGAGAEAWLERAVLMLGAPSIREQLGAAGIALRPIGGLTNLSGLLDSHTQVRWQRDFAVDYRVDGAAADATEEVVELGQVVHEDTWTGGPADLTESVTEVL